MRYEETKEAKARNKLATAIKSGQLVRPSRCEDCGKTSTKITAHHSNYDKPLDVKWVCWSCHSKYHSHDRLKLWDKDALRFCDTAIVEPTSFEFSIELRMWLDEYAKGKNISPDMLLNYVVYRFMKQKNKRF